MNTTDTLGRARVLPAEPHRYNGGIRTLEDLRGRCKIDDITGCWNWGMGCDGNGRPSVWMPDLHRRTSLGVAICWIKTGKLPAPGVVWHLTCRNMLCANPAHRKVGTRSTQMLAAKVTRTPLTRARISANRRGGSKLKPEQFEDIRSGGKLLREICEQHGISMSYASLIRSGKDRQPVSAPGSSIFSMARRARA